VLLGCEEVAAGLLAEGADARCADCGGGHFVVLLVVLV
jgi:hypothetical protein